MLQGNYGKARFQSCVSARVAPLVHPGLFEQLTSSAPASPQSKIVRRQASDDFLVLIPFFWIGFGEREEMRLETRLVPFNLWRMTSIWDLANAQLRDLAVYEPGKPIEETARELGIDPAEIVKLASNENPLGPVSKGNPGHARRAGECASLSRWQRILPGQRNRSETWSTSRRT